MLSDLKRRKFTAWFNLYDVDKTGYIERGDLEQVSRNLARLHGYGEDSQYFQTYIQIWEGMRQQADVDTDERIGLEEFLQAQEALTSNPDIATHAALAMSEQQIQMLDRDGDGKLGESEVVAQTLAHNQTEEYGKVIFRHLDRNGNGAVSKEELMQAVEEFLFSEDPDAPGNWLCGEF